MARDIILREVGLRDGLQIHPGFMATEHKLAWIKAEAEAGIQEIEVTSYAPARILPQFADAEEVTVKATRISGLTVSALIPNLRGAERGFDLGAHKLNFVVSVSETHNLKNVRRSRAESLEDFKNVVALAKRLPAEARPKVCGGLATALGCSYEGSIAVSEVVRVAVALAEAGADEITIPDTVGYANPTLVRQVFSAVSKELGQLPIAAHFHDTRGTGLANVVAAIDCGIRLFDASLGGLGGCPFAPGASGNIVMEDACFMIEAMGFSTGVDIDKLIAVRQIVTEALPDIELHGAIARAGLPRGFVYPASANANAA
ncbi:hydroxymethylglutaryl-CoA lyase [Parapusillimonas sp. JC17]|uniref:hydroxymethylglutaryl-CoA lyase n=1 Tax=Parapusillimonas sp. JC17 TaxID=3445768 RepID=UPI003FA0070A